MKLAPDFVEKGARRCGRERSRGMEVRASLEWCYREVNIVVAMCGGGWMVMVELVECHIKMTWMGNVGHVCLERCRWDKCGAIWECRVEL